MRVHITQAVSGSIDGIQLARFEVGREYVAGTPVANYLLSTGCATPVADERPLTLNPVQNRLMGGIRQLARAAADATAADGPRRKRKRASAVQMFRGDEQ